MEAEKNGLSIEPQLADQSDIVKSVPDLNKPGTVLELKSGQLCEISLGSALTGNTMWSCQSQS